MHRDRTHQASVQQQHVPVDHYEMLGVESTASHADLKKAYHQQCLCHHPDKNLEDITATSMFQRIREAYEILSDPVRRQEYDRSLMLSDPVAVMAKVGVPQTMAEWQHAQDVIFRGHDPLPAGWIRCWSKTANRVYYARMSDAMTSFSISEIN